MFNDNRDASPFEVEGNLVKLAIGMNVGMIMSAGRPRRGGYQPVPCLIGLALDRLIQRIAHTGFVQTIQIGEQKDPFRYRAEWIDVLVQSHLAAGERAGLVAAQEHQCCRSSASPRDA